MRCPVGRTWLAACLILACSPVVAQDRAERLVIGEQKTFKTGYAVGDIAISNPSVCDFRVVSGRREIMLIANGEGFTTLTVWDQRGVKRDEVGIEVLSREFARVLADLTELLRPYPDVTIKTLGKRAVVGGTVNRADEFDNVRALAQASGAVFTVTLKSAAPPSAAVPPSREPFAPTPAPVVAPTPVPPPAAPSIVRDPEPPPPVRRAPAVLPGTAAPVPVGSGSAPPTAIPVKPEAVPQAAPPQPVHVPAPAPPPPNVSAAPPVQAPVPSASPAGSSDWSTPVGAGSIEYLVELYEAPSSGPPPEVAGPQGKRLYIGRLRTDPDIEIRHLIQFAPGPGGASAAQRGFSIGLVPTLSGTTIRTAVTVDTNLPMGPYDQAKNPVWLRSTVTFSSRAGQTRYILEAELAKTAKPASGSAPAPAAPGPGSRVGERALDAGAAAVGLPSPSGLGVGTAAPPRVRATQLLLVLTPSLVRPANRPDPDPIRPVAEAEVRVHEPRR